MNAADKVCPVVFRDSSMRHILAFEHPQAGVQLVKGGVAPGESLHAAALRKLAEEAGIADTAVARDLGTWNSGHRGHVWSLQLCTYPPQLPETWTHQYADADGQEFRFFWHDMTEAANERWKPQYRRALEAIRERTRAFRWRG